MARNVCITAADGQTGHLIAELLLTNDTFKVDSLTALTMHPTASKAKHLDKLGAKVVTHKPGRERDMVRTLKDTGCDTICLIPPAHKDKFDIVAELVAAAKKADIGNVLLISSAGCDLADAQKQPRLKEFIDLECMVMATKGDPNVKTGHSPCIIRAGFYAENLLLYQTQIQKEGVLPLPIGKNHKFAPVALGDVAQVAAFVLSGKGKHGFDDKHRGQLMVVTGPMLATGDELAEAANQVLGTKLEFEDISDAEARRALHSQTHIDNSEKEYLLQYYSLVKEGKTNYVSTTAFRDVTGSSPQEPPQFFEVYEDSFHPEHAKKKRKVENGN